MKGPKLDPTGEVVIELDVTGRAPRELDRIFDGMVLRIDFERFELVDSEAHP